MLERSRSTFRLKPKERCPGEIICTSDPINGVISRMVNETLETYCLADRCKFYWTKEGTIPLKFMGLFEAAMLMREARLGELKRLFAYYEHNFPAWAIEAYKAAERAFRVAENEIGAESPEEREGGGTGKKFTDGGDSDAFAVLENQIREADALSKDPDEWQRILELNPHISENNFEYLRANTW